MFKKSQPPQGPFDEPLYPRALYMEWRRNDQTMMLILTPEMIDPATKNKIPIHLLSRQLTPNDKQPAWRKRTSPVSSDTPLAPDGSIPLADSVSEAIAQANTLFRPIEGFVSSLPESNWELYKQPLSVEISEPEMTMLAGGNTPDGLWRRITKARIEAGYSHQFIAETDS